VFSHAPADRPSPSDAAHGDPGLDARWRAATAGWRPSGIRSVDADRTWTWVRHAWEGVVAAAGDDGTPAGGDLAPGPDRRVQDLMTVAGLLEVQRRFLAVAAGGTDEAEAADPRADGAPLGDAEALAVVQDTWEIDPQEAEQDPEGFAAEVSGLLRDRLAELADDVRDRLLDRRGPTQVFAELWSLEHADELDAAPDGQPRAPFPLSTDDVAWIVSGVPGPGKRTAWEWLTR